MTRVLCAHCVVKLLAWVTKEWAKHVFRGYEVVIFIREKRRPTDRLPNFKQVFFNKLFRENKQVNEVTRFQAINGYFPKVSFP